MDLGQQIGPLPLGAGVAVVAGGLGIAFYTRRNGSAPVEVPVNDTSGQEGVGTGPGWVAVAPPTTGPPGVGKPTTNEEWAVQAQNYLINAGYDPVTADLAIRKYLESSDLTIPERAMLGLALAFLGAPPVPLPAPVDSGQLAAPQNLRATGSTNSTITLAWDAVPGAKRYIVGLQGVAGMWHNMVDETGVPYYTSTGLRPNTQYTFTVFAQDVDTGTEGIVSARQGPTSGITARTTA